MWVFPGFWSEKFLKRSRVFLKICFSVPTRPEWIPAMVPEFGCAIKIGRQSAVLTKSAVPFSWVIRASTVGIGSLKDGVVLRMAISSLWVCCI